MPTEAIRKSSVHHAYRNRPGLKAANKPLFGNNLALLIKILEGKHGERKSKIKL